MNNKKRYNKLNEYYENKFGERTLKICINGGFTCPNRDGSLGNKGCIYCSEKGSGELIYPIENITEQVKYYFTTYRAKRANRFIVYFQNFTNTYDTVENLKKKYDAALIDDRIVGISIGTRPDCIDENVAKLLKSYTNNYYVCVELGLQTSNNEIGNIIKRAYSSEQFTKAVETLNKYNIDVVAHIMIGLPTETEKDICNTVNFLNKHKIQGVKIHSTYIVENTELAELYKKSKYTPLEIDEYIDKLIYIITHLNPNIVIHRIVGDAPKKILIAPEWSVHKLKVLNCFEQKMQKDDLWQGKYY